MDKRISRSQTPFGNAFPDALRRTARRFDSKHLLNPPHLMNHQGALYPNSFRNKVRCTPFSHLGTIKNKDLFGGCNEVLPTLHDYNAETTNLSFFDEWNYRRRSYHKNWCTLKEVPITPQDDGFIQQTLQKYRPLIQHLRRSFETFRAGDKRLKRQLDGDEVDIDALIETLADTASGLEMSQHVFTRLHKVERDVVVIFLVDMSGSTKGWINLAERESLVLLCEAVETLGDRYGIYGFSGMTRTRCEIYPIKTLEETYDDTVRERICAIKAKDYTRMGAAIIV